MKIALIALGTRGDVQPYIALACGLKNAGHEVSILTHENFEGLVRLDGVEFQPLQGSVQEIIEASAMKGLMEKGSFFAITRQMAHETKRASLFWARDGLKACHNVELLIAGTGGLFLGLALGEKLNLPLIQAHLMPFTPTSTFPSVLLPSTFSRLGGTSNYLSHQLTRQMIWHGFRAADTSMRREVLNLSPSPFWGPDGLKQLQQLPMLYGFSPSVIPKPQDWNSSIHVTGYWFLDSASEWSPPPELEHFINQGPPPVCIGFGSMGSRQPEKSAQTILQALAPTRQRAILLTGWGGLSSQALPDHVFMADSIPHDWLFPRLAAVVHHGGAGTTAAGLRAGIPSIIVPFFGDQAFWGGRVANLGVGPNPIPRSKLNSNNLSHAIQEAVYNPLLRRRAFDLGVRIRSENGVVQAVGIINEWVNKGCHKSSTSCFSVASKRRLSD